MQALLAVRDWNFWLSACASLPFWALKSDPDPEADELAAALGVGEEVLATEEALAAEEEPAAEEETAAEEELAADAAEEAEEEAEPFPAPLPPGTPGDWTIASSCCPAGTVPPGFAGQLPGGFTGAVRPKGMVPAWPTALPFANFVGSTPWN